MVGQALDVQDSRWQAEVLRRASVVLHGRMVGVWEVTADESLVPVTTGAPSAVAQGATPEVAVALRRLRMPAPHGSRWVAGRVANGGEWCVAPVRSQVPEPPPLAQERRRAERLALELAGLCLGLSDKVAGQEGSRYERDLFRQFREQLGALAHEVATPLGTARSGLAELGVALRALQPDPVLRDKLLEELRAADRALQQAAAIVQTVQDRARAVLEQSGDFDVAEVVWSAVTAERSRAAAHGVTIDVRTLSYVLAITGAANDLQRAVVFLLRGAVSALRGQTGTVGVTLEDLGPVARLTLQATAAGTALERARAPVDAGTGWVLDEARQIVESLFGGSLAVSSAAEGAIATVTLAVRPRRRPPAM